MADTTYRYEPRNFRRVCDVCGLLRNFSEMHKQDELWVCTYDAGERVRTELDRGNANQRPFTIKPVPYPKPQSDYYPNLLETDDAAVFNFLAQQVTARCRYELVQSGHAVAPVLGDSLPALSWAARYFYDLIQENDPSRRLLIPDAKVYLAQIAAYVTTRQQGFGLSSTSTRANDAFYGGFLEPGATTWTTNDTASCGLALLYAYRVLGNLSYRDGARAAASYLRNVQAIGSNGTNYTSTDAAGSGRLYTGSLASEVSTASGFYSNSLFYPSALLALEFWNELKTTDGDQSVGATGTPTGFSTIPAQLLSLSITDLRDCWSTGITDSTGTLVNGLSSTTPAEFFNAFPAVKPNFTLLGGTGLWEYADAAGTEISSQNFSQALSSLYSYEGATSQVTAISDWLRSFTSNADFETPANTSIPVLYRGTTGTYDPTIAPATLLTVRASGGAVKVNGSSLYDWGSFGLLSRLWASRNKGSFMQSRLYPLNIVQRYFDGNANDGLTSDRIILRGESGLTFQTAFAVDGSGNAVTAGSASTSTPTPPTVGLVFWVKGDAGLVTVVDPDVGPVVVRWRDQSGFGQDVVDLPGNPGPYAGRDTISGIPCATWDTDGGHGATALRGLFRVAGLVDRNGHPFGYGTGETQARTVVAVIMPRYSATAFDITGGIVCEMGSTPAWQPLFDLEPNFGNARGFYLFSAGFWRGAANAGPDTTGGVAGPYNGTPIVVEWNSTGFDNLGVRLNGSTTALTPSVMGGGTGPTINPQFSLGRQSSGGFNFFGAMSEMLIFDHVLDDDERVDLTTYIGARYTGASNQILMVNDAVRAAQFGRSFREARQ